MIRRLTAAVVLCALVVSAAAATAADKFFESNGVKIHYVIEGQGEPVVDPRLHRQRSRAMGMPEFVQVRSNYQVIALDNRGHGRSGKPHDPKQYGTEMVGDVIRLLDHLTIKKAHIVGYSMGGFMTGYLLTAHPERVITATLGGAGWSQADDTRLSFLTDLAESLDAGKGIGPLIVHLTPADRPKPTEEQISAINQMLMLTNDSKALAACIRGMKGLEVTEAQLRANKVPTLCLIGDQDPLKEGVDAMQKVMANVTVEVIEGTDHMTCFRAPAFIEDLQAFLASHSKAKETVGAGGQ
jgi:pimeloyl-ACP methyl ester carboxylesterase